MVALPFCAYQDLPVDALAGEVVIDAMHYLRMGDGAVAEIVSSHQKVSRGDVALTRTTTAATALDARSGLGGPVAQRYRLAACLSRPA
jgi:hypothetical protein